MSTQTTSQCKEKKLLHPILHQIPESIRFGLAGFISNVVFVLGLNHATHLFGDTHPASTIYALYTMCHIPFGHALNSHLVFGWPKPYMPSLLKNAPIGLTAMTLGTFITSFLVKISFESKVVNVLKDIGLGKEDEIDENGNFYSSLMVMLVTGVWSFGLTTIINSPKSPNKNKGNKDL